MPIEDDSYLGVDLTLFLNDARKVSLKRVESHVILNLEIIYISLWTVLGVKPDTLDFPPLLSSYSFRLIFQ